MEGVWLGKDNSHASAAQMHADDQLSVPNHTSY